MYFLLKMSTVEVGEPLGDVAGLVSRVAAQASSIRDTWQGKSAFSTKYNASFWHAPVTECNQSQCTIQGEHKLHQDNVQEAWDSFATKCANLVKNLITSLSKTVSTCPGERATMHLDIKNRIYHHDSRNSSGCKPTGFLPHWYSEPDGCDQSGGSLSCPKDHTEVLQFFDNPSSAEDNKTTAERNESDIPCCEKNFINTISKDQDLPLEENVKENLKDESPTSTSEPTMNTPATFELLYNPTTPIPNDKNLSEDTATSGTKKHFARDSAALHQTKPFSEEGNSKDINSTGNAVNPTHNDRIDEQFNGTFLSVGSRLQGNQPMQTENEFPQRFKEPKVLVSNSIPAEGSRETSFLKATKHDFMDEIPQDFKVWNRFLDSTDDRTTNKILVENGHLFGTEFNHQNFSSRQNVDGPHLPEQGSLISAEKNLPALEGTAVGLKKNRFLLDVPLQEQEGSSSSSHRQILNEALEQRLLPIGSNVLDTNQENNRPSSVSSLQPMGHLDREGNRNAEEVRNKSTRSSGFILPELELLNSQPSRNAQEQQQRSTNFSFAPFSKEIPEKGFGLQESHLVDPKIQYDSADFHDPKGSGQENNFTSLEMSENNFETFGPNLLNSTQVSQHNNYDHPSEPMKATIAAVRPISERKPVQNSLSGTNKIRKEGLQGSESHNNSSPKPSKTTVKVLQPNNPPAEKGASDRTRQSTHPAQGSLFLQENIGDPVGEKETDGIQQISMDPDMQNSQSVLEFPVQRPPNGLEVVNHSRQSYGKEDHNSSRSLGSFSEAQMGKRPLNGGTPNKASLPFGLSPLESNYKNNQSPRSSPEQQEKGYISSHRLLPYGSSGQDLTETKSKSPGADHLHSQSLWDSPRQQQKGNSVVNKETSNGTSRQNLDPFETYPLGTDRLNSQPLRVSPGQEPRISDSLDKQYSDRIIEQSSPSSNSNITDMDHKIFQPLNGLLQHQIEFSEQRDNHSLNEMPNEDSRPDDTNFLKSNPRNSKPLSGLLSKQLEGTSFLDRKISNGTTERESLSTLATSSVDPESQDSQRPHEDYGLFETHSADQDFAVRSHNEPQVLQNLPQYQGNNGSASLGSFISGLSNSTEQNFTTERGSQEQFLKTFSFAHGVTPTDINAALFGHHEPFDKQNLELRLLNGSSGPLTGELHKTGDHGEVRNESSTSYGSQPRNSSLQDIKSFSGLPLQLDERTSGPGGIPYLDGEVSIEKVLQDSKPFFKHPSSPSDAENLRNEQNIIPGSKEIPPPVNYDASGAIPEDSQVQDHTLMYFPNHIFLNNKEFFNGTSHANLHLNSSQSNQSSYQQQEENGSPLFQSNSFGVSRKNSQTPGNLSINQTEVYGLKKNYIPDGTLGNTSSNFGLHQLKFAPEIVQSSRELPQPQQIGSNLVNGTMPNGIQDRGLFLLESNPPDTEYLSSHQPQGTAPQQHEPGELLDTQIPAKMPHQNFSSFKPNFSDTKGNYSLWYSPKQEQDDVLNRKILNPTQGQHSIQLGSKPPGTDQKNPLSEPILDKTSKSSFGSLDSRLIDSGLSNLPHDFDYSTQGTGGYGKEKNLAPELRPKENSVLLDAGSQESQAPKKSLDTSDKTFALGEKYQLPFNSYTLELPNSLKQNGSLSPQGGITADVEKSSKSPVRNKILSGIAVGNQQQSSAKPVFLSHGTENLKINHPMHSPPESSSLMVKNSLAVDTPKDMNIKEQQLLKSRTPFELEVVTEPSSPEKVHSSTLSSTTLCDADYGEIESHRPGQTLIQGTSIAQGVAQSLEGSEDIEGDSEESAFCDECHYEDITDHKAFCKNACRDLEQAREELKAIFEKIKKKLKCIRKNRLEP